MADTSYDALSRKAKLTFMKRLVKHMEREGLSQRDIAAAVRMKPPTISGFFREPDNVSENFIRMISVSGLESLETEYQRFRSIVDAPFLPDGGFMGYDGVDPEERHKIIDETVAAMIEACNRMRRLI